MGFDENQTHLINLCRIISSNIGCRVAFCHKPSTYVSRMRCSSGRYGLCAITWQRP